MISIIICSVNQQHFDTVSNNIANTIGTAFEIIRIDNLQNKYGICAAYNLGAAKAKGNILCFMHEDICFETMNWGTLVINHLSDESTGMIGVAGGTSKSLVPSGWSPAIFDSEINVVQHFRFSAEPPKRICKTKFTELKTNRTEVVAIDGVWMCVRKEVFDDVSFDATTFTGFHGYDIDFSFQVFCKYEIYVVFDILLHHYSEGSFDNAWLTSTIKVSEKWNNILPVSADQLSKEEVVRQHWTCMRFFLQKIKEQQMNKLTIFAYFIRYSFNSMFNAKHFLSCMKSIIFS
jgi:GT2 family glycosyltransferase